MDRLMADEQIKPIFTGEPPGAMYVPKTDKNTLFLSYPCRDNTVLNVALFHETIKHQEDTNDWNSHASVEDALGILADFHPVWRSIVGKADFMNVYTVRHGIDCPRLVKGKAIVIGDAAHPMLPSYAQGGAMALEDAASLEILLAGMKAVEGLENRLKIFEQLRLPRSTTTQVLSNAAFLSSGTNKEDVIRKYYQGPLFEPLNAPGFSRPVRDFWYGYNIISEARKAFEYRNSLDGIPDGALKPFGR
jgi:salicylate hydroxylase